jgi:hypothetical protein
VTVVILRNEVMGVILRNEVIGVILRNEVTKDLSPSTGILQLRYAQLQDDGSDDSA